MNPRAATALVLVCVLGLGAVVLAARGREKDSPPPAGSKFEGALMPRGVRAPDIGLSDQDGKTVSMRRLRGRPVIVTFLYTHCRETCPATAQTIKGALDDLGRDVPAVAVAVDPPRDTPASAKAFLARQRMLGRLRFALGSRAELRPAWNGFAIQPQTTTQEHQARITLVDKRGFQRIGFPGDQDVGLLERE